jgi:RNA polymerase sigma factor (sigma-70 family)
MSAQCRQGDKPMMLQQNRPTDPQLLDAFAAGDPAAFATLVERHAVWIFAAAQRQLADRQLAEDATQAVFILLSRRANRLTAHRNLTGWLFMTTRYTVQAIRRAERRRRIHERRAAMNRMEAHTDPPAFTGTLDAAVAQLPAPEQAALLLRFYQGLEFTEVAVTLGISEAAARKRVTRAVDRLRGRLGDALSTGTLSIAAMHGTPANLTAFTAHITPAALGAASGIPAAASVGAATKGATMLMTLASLKTAAIATAAALLLAGGGLTAWSLASPVAATAPAAPATTEASALPVTGQHVSVKRTKPFSDFAPSTNAATLYQSPDHPDHIVRIAPPFTPDRLDFYKRLNKDSPFNPVTKPSVLLVRWNNDQPIAWDIFLNGRPYPDYTAEDIIQSLLSISPPNIEGPPELLQQPIPGDFMVCADGAAVEQAWRRGIETLLGDATGRGVKMTFVDVDRPAYVFRGTWSGKLPDGTPWTPKTKHSLQIYANNLDDINKGSSWMGGNLDQFSQFLGGFVNQSVIFEAAIDSQLSWHVIGEGDHDMMHARSHDPALVIQHIEEQTGLTATVETRKIHRLLVEWRN